MTREVSEEYKIAVSYEAGRMIRAGYNAAHDDAHGIEHLLEQAYIYAANGQTVKAGVMISAAGAWVTRNLDGRNKMQKDIETFMLACDQEVKKYPELTTDEVRKLRIRLMTSEVLGYNGSTDIPLVDALFYGLVEDKSNELVASMLTDDLVGIADGIADVLYVVIGTASAYGIDIQTVFDEVHRSNMSKTVWDEETKSYSTIKDEGGKVLKPEGYRPPNVAKVLFPNTRSE